MDKPPGAGVCARWRIDHLSCGSMCPYSGHLWDGVTPGLGPATIVCHCLLIEAADSLVLVDTGFGLGDIARPTRLSAFFRNVNRVQLDAGQTARRQIERLGLRPDDVRHIVLTHLDFDHAGGIEDFPNATRARDGCRAARRDIARPRRSTGAATGRRNGTMPSDGRRYRASGRALVRVRVRARSGRIAAGNPDGAARRAHGRPRRDRDPRSGRLAAARRRRLFLPRRDGPATAIAARRCCAPTRS